MRILIVSQHFWPEEFRVNDLAAGLVERGHNVTVLTGKPNYPGGDIFEAYRQDPSAFSEYAGARIVRAPLIARGKGGALRLMLNYLSFAVTGSTIGVWRLRHLKFDAAFVFQTSPITAAIPALVMKRVKRTPVLLWVQDLWPDTLAAIGVFRSRPLLGLVGLLVSGIYRGCDRILVQSRDFEERVRHYAGPTKPVDYFPNWFEPMFSGRAAPAAELKGFASTFNIMFAGNLGEAQDLPTIVEAAGLCRDLTNLRWLVVGDGRARSTMQRAVEQMNLSDRIVFLGRHSSVRMPDFFQSADAMLVSLKAQPIWSMTIPSKVQSYMAAGRPVLGMIDGEGARVITESGSGWSSPAGDAKGLADNVRRLLELSSEEREAMGDAGQVYAHTHFDRTILIAELEMWFEEARSAVR